MNKIKLYLNWLALLFTFGAILLFGFWMIYPYEPIVFTGDPFPVVNKTVKVGDHVQYEVSYCKKMVIGGTVSRSFEDGLVYATPELETNTDTGCHTNIISVYVPKALPAGEFFIKTVYTYQVNPVRKVTVTTYTEHFTVTK